MDPSTHNQASHKCIKGMGKGRLTRVCFQPSKNQNKSSMVVHTFNPATQEVEARRIAKNSRQAKLLI